MKRSLFLLLLLSVLVPAAYGQFSNPDGGDVERGVLPAKWTTGGPKCMEIPEWQVHEYNPTSSSCASPAAPTRRCRFFI